MPLGGAALHAGGSRRIECAVCLTVEQVDLVDDCLQLFPGDPLLAEQRRRQPVQEEQRAGLVVVQHLQLVPQIGPQRCLRAATYSTPTRFGQPAVSDRECNGTARRRSSPIEIPRSCSDSSTILHCRRGILEASSLVQFRRWGPMLRLPAPGSLARTDASPHRKSRDARPLRRKRWRAVAAEPGQLFQSSNNRT